MIYLIILDGKEDHFYSVLLKAKKYVILKDFRPSLLKIFF